MGLNCPLGPAQRVNTGSHKAYHGTIYPQFIYPQILNPGVFAVLDFTRKIPLIFGGSCPNWAQF